jgi:DNA-binding response OmpR family regulator
MDVAIIDAAMGAALQILTVDDEPSITQSMRFIFSAPRYEVTSAQDGDDALATLEANAHVYDVIIIDQKMPHLTGVELVEEIRKRGFAGKIMVLSAHLSSEIREAYEHLDVRVMLDKPFNIHELRSTLDRLAA